MTLSGYHQQKEFGLFYLFFIVLGRFVDECRLKVLEKKNMKLGINSSQWSKIEKKNC